MQELEEIGCYFKDWNFSIGLIDFPAILMAKKYSSAGEVMKMILCIITT
jgi:hypothetical protein